jgi:oligosaccharide repeat unit polymerase
MFMTTSQTISSNQPTQLSTSSHAGKLVSRNPLAVPRVRPAEWILCIAFAALAVLAGCLSSYEQIEIALTGQMILSLILVSLSARDALRYRCLGKLILTFGPFYFFTLGAWTMGAESEPFPFLNRPHMGGGQYDFGTVKAGIIFVALFQLALFAGYSLRPRVTKLLKWFRNRVDNRRNKLWSLRYLFAACAILPFFLSMGLHLDRVIASLLASRSGGNVEHTDIGLLGVVAEFGLSGSSILLLQGLLEGSRKRFLWLLLGLISFSPALLGGTRHLVLYVAVPVLVGMLRTVRGINLKKRVAVVALIALIVYALITLQYEFRYSGWKSIIAASAEDLIQQPIEATGQFDALLFAIYLVPNDHPYFLEPIEPYFVFHLVPRALWEGKPVPKAWQFYDDSYTAGQDFNVTPSIIGQYFMNFGVPGILYGGLMLGFFMFLADSVTVQLDASIHKAMIVLVGMFYAFLISSFRYVHPMYFAHVEFGALAMLAISISRSGRGRSGFGSMVALGKYYQK